ncbi:MAG: hypothetical protein M3R39_04980 [Actinomycetota bacterium]|nr:hypothetical protein [Actinomycetota bacterium]
MNWAGLSNGTKVLLVGGVILFIDTFFAWQQICAGAAGFHVCGSASGWHGIGVLMGLLVIALVAWEGLQIAGVTKQIELPVSAVLISVALAGATALVTIIKFLVANEARHWPAWIGLILAVVIAAGGWLKYKESPAAPAQATPPPPPPPAPPA